MQLFCLALLVFHVIGTITIASPPRRTIVRPHGFKPRPLSLSLQRPLGTAMIVDRDKAARELIAFYHEAGVDVVIGEDPINRLAEDRAPALEGPDEHPPAATVAAREHP